MRPEYLGGRDTHNHIPVVWFIGQLSLLLVPSLLCPLHGGHRRGITCLLGALFYTGRSPFSSLL